MIPVKNKETKAVAIEGLVRNEAYESLIEVIREIIVNAHCHCNLTDAGFIEEWGTGIRKIRQAAERYGLSSPEIQAFDDMFRVNLYRRLLSEISDDSGKTSENHR